MTEFPKVWGFIPADEDLELPPDEPERMWLCRTCQNPCSTASPFCSDKCAAASAIEVNLAASERAMQMICAVTCSGKDPYQQMRTINRVVNAWVHAPGKLTPNAMVENLPELR